MCYRDREWDEEVSQDVAATQPGLPLTQHTRGEPAVWVLPSAERHCLISLPGMAAEGPGVWRSHSGADMVVSVEGCCRSAGSVASACRPVHVSGSEVGRLLGPCSLSLTVCTSSAGLAGCFLHVLFFFVFFFPEAVRTIWAQRLQVRPSPGEEIPLCPGWQHRGTTRSAAQRCPSVCLPACLLVSLPAPTFLRKIKHHPLSAR